VSSTWTRTPGKASENKSEKLAKFQLAQRRTSGDRLLPCISPHADHKKPRSAARFFKNPLKNTNPPRQKKTEQNITVD
jgi:hypothetical protein